MPLSGVATTAPKFQLQVKGCKSLIALFIPFSVIIAALRFTPITDLAKKLFPFESVL